MTKYFIFKGDFGNQYSLCYTKDGSEPTGAERITRKEAERYALDEVRRQKEEPMSSGYADDYVWPYNMAGLPGVTGAPGDPDYLIDAENIISWALHNCRGYRLSGRVITHE